MLDRERSDQPEVSPGEVPISIERGYRIALRTRNVLVGCVATGSVWLGLAIAWQLLISNRLEQTPTAALMLPVVLILGPVFWAVMALIVRHGEQVEAQLLLAHDRGRAVRNDTDSRVHSGGRRRSVETLTEPKRLPHPPLFEEAPVQGRVSSYVPLPEEFGVEDLDVGRVPDSLDDRASSRRSR